MKTKIMCVAALLSGVTLSCSQDDVLQSHDKQTLQNVSVAVPDTTQTITIEHVKRIINSRKKTRAGVKEIKEIIPIKTDSGTPLLYVVNFSNKKGFIVVSATKDYLPILAYSESGEFNLDSIKKIGTSLYFEDFKSLVASAPSFPDSIKKNFQAMWESYSVLYKPLSTMSRTSTDVANLISSSVGKWQQEGYTVYTVADYKISTEFQQLPEDVQYKIANYPYGYGNGNYGAPEVTSFVLRKEIDDIKEVPSFIKTKWGQGSSKEPVGDYNEYVEHGCVAGCVTIATSQILKYYQYASPYSYNWEAMSDLYPTKETARFIADVGKAVKAEYKEDNKNESPSNIDKALKALKNYGYSDAKKVKHESWKVIGNLNNKQPIYMRGKTSKRGDGHAWVCDGYSGGGANTIELKLMTLENCPETVEPTCFLNPFNYSKVISYSPLYLHMNWGWSGYQDGYYNDADINIKLYSGDLTLNHDRQDIIDIQPNK